MIDWIVEAFQWLWEWLLGILQTLALTVWNGLELAIPTFDSAALQTVADLLIIGNRWVPIDVLVGAIGAHWAFLGVFVSVKMVLKFIPGIG